MLAKAFFAVEPELVGGVGAVYARLKRVAITPGAQTLEHDRHQFGRIAGITWVAAQFGRPCQGARVKARRQFQVVLQCCRAPLRAVAEIGVTPGPVTQQVGHRTVRQPLQLGRHGELHAAHHGFCRRGVEHEDPGAVVGLKRDLVGNGWAFHLQIGRVLPGAREAGAQHAPLTPIERGQYRPAKIQIGLARRRAVEADAQRDAVVQRERGDGADFHAGRQSAAPGHRVAGHAPQRRQTRKQHEQQRHDGRAQQGHGGGGPGGFAQGRFADRHMRVDQCRQQTQQGHQHRGRGQQRLRKEKIGQHREEAQEEDHERIALGTQLERFEREQHNDQRHPGIAPEQGAVGHQRGAGRQQQQQQQPPARGQGTRGPGQPATPQQHSGRQQTAPDRQLANLGCYHPGDHQQQEQGVAGVARQVFEALEHLQSFPERYKASASRQRRLWASPLPGRISCPSRRRP